MGLAEQADKLIEWGNTATEGAFGLLKGHQEGKQAQQQQDHEMRMGSFNEFLRERQHSRTMELVRLASSKGVKTAAIRAGLDVVTTSVNALAADIVNQREYERNRKLISASQQAAEDLEWHRALVQVALHDALRTRELELANSPFSHTPEAVREHVVEATGDGRKPVLLIAPFYHEGAVTADNGPRFVVAVRQAWLTSHWHGDLEPMAGLIDRPLHRLDVDVRTVQQVLHDLPVVLVYGQAQEGGRIWPSLAAWNILPGTDCTSLHMNFPPMPLTAAGDPAEAQDIGDRLGRMFSLAAGNLGDWFHLLRHERAPRMHILLAAGEDSERALASTSAADSYDFLAATGRLDTHLAYAHQARILAEGGLTDLARRMARTALAELASLPLDDGTRHLAALRELLGVFGLLGDVQYTAEAEALREAAAQRRLDQLHGWEGRR
ncbi:hypothetical protein AV521_31010 [Streptomyces sp. IMTB 2501]|uniref:hypothetical protein n=1 Tax=Streptomyces sp. IMTB 2501 TaxID=1776340 RepID=UPI00096FD432|nr:hypothetical protein [Streptomyces sp. IMTB 2501]OLZ65505.1 hypothetical protein AV521_31010 [Streptomyces sp. IMTB 2501]